MPRYSFADVMKVVTVLHFGLGLFTTIVTGCGMVKSNGTKDFANIVDSIEKEGRIRAEPPSIYRDIGITFQGDAFNDGPENAFKYKLLMYEHQQDKHNVWQINRDDQDQPIPQQKPISISLEGQVDLDGDGTANFDLGLIDIKPAQYGFAKESRKPVDCVDAFSLVFVDNVSNKIDLNNWRGKNCFVEIQATGGDTGVSVTIFPKSEPSPPDEPVQVSSPATSGQVNREFVNWQTQAQFTPEEVAQNMADNWERNPGGEQRESFRNGCLKNAKTNRWSDIQAHYYCLFDYPLRQCYSTALIENLYNKPNLAARHKAAEVAPNEDAAYAITQQMFAQQAIQAGAAAMKICFKTKDDFLNRFGNTEAEVKRGLEIFSTIMLSNILSHNLGFQYVAINKAYKKMNLDRPRRLVDWIDPRGVTKIEQPRHAEVLQKQLQAAK